MGFFEPREADLHARRGPASSTADERRLAPGEVLLTQGDTDDDVYEVIAGSLEVLRGPQLARIAVVRAGATVGEIAAVAGCPRTATVRALESSLVRRADGEDYRRWLVQDERRLQAMADIARSRIDAQRAIALVSELLGIGTASAAEVVALGEWRDIGAGAVVFAEGDPSDAGYLVVSGRLAAWRDGVQLGEIGRGEVLGEVGLIERSARTATVISLRDSTLVRFSAESFRALAASHPSLMLQLSRTILARLRRPNANSDRARTVAVTVTAPVDVRWLVTQVANEVGRFGETRHLWAARIDTELGRPGLVESDHAATRPALSEYLQDAETTHDYLVLETDSSDTRWTRHALTLADRVLIVMSAEPDDDERHRIDAVLAATPAGITVERWVALVHPSGVERPHRSAEVAEQFRFDRVAHLREGSNDDLRRLARLVSGNATGLVLGGGGARGFAHLGVWRALNELGIDIDIIGGASIGAPLGGVIALQIPPEEMVPLVTELFHDLLDYTVPVVSLVKGERISRNISKMFAGLDLRDFWLPFFCVSTNLTRSRVEVHDKLDAPTAVRASVAIPGILPPVPFAGDLLVDGGVLNNLPCDVMRATRTTRRLIAVDLSTAAGPSAYDDFGLSVSGWKALRAQLGSGPSRFPGLAAVLMRALVAGSLRDRDRMRDDGTIDWYLDLDLGGVQLLDFDRVAEVADRGYEAARPRLEAWLTERGT